MKKLSLSLLIAVLLGSCSPKFDVSSFSKNSWILRSWAANIPYNSGVSLKFDTENKISGKSFCNSYGGVVAITDTAIKFEKIYATKMFCEGKSELENKYLKDLEETDFAKISGGKLLLYKNGHLMMTFSEPR